MSLTRFVYFFATGSLAGLWWFVEMPLVTKFIALGLSYLASVAIWQWTTNEKK